MKLLFIRQNTADITMYVFVYQDDEGIIYDGHVPGWSGLMPPKSGVSSNELTPVQNALYDRYIEIAIRWAAGEFSRFGYVPAHILFPGRYGAK